MSKEKLILFLEKKAEELRKKTIEIHYQAPETRIASSLSCIELFTILYYGNILHFSCFPDGRDRLVISKGHGAICLYAILQEFGYLKNLGVCKSGSKYGSIPSSSLKTVTVSNGSLGNGIGIGCGISLALKTKKSSSHVCVLVGDGELNEGANWEAIMFAGHHRLSNLFLIVDNNRISMLDYCKNIIKLEPLENKFRVFGWAVKRVNGHNIRECMVAINYLINIRSCPKVLIADTIKGKGVPQLEKDTLCHIRSLS